MKLSLARAIEELQEGRLVWSQLLLFDLDVLTLLMTRHCLLSSLFVWVCEATKALPLSQCCDGPWSGAHFRWLDVVSFRSNSEDSYFWPEAEKAGLTSFERYCTTNPLDSMRSFALCYYEYAVYLYNRSVMPNT